MQGDGYSPGTEGIEGRMLFGGCQTRRKAELAHQAQVVRALAECFKELDLNMKSIGVGEKHD